MKRRTVLSGLAAAPLAAALPARAATQWDFYTFVGLTHPITVQLRQFADEVKKRTKGDLAIGVRIAGELPFKCARRPNFDHPCRLNIDQGWKPVSFEASCG